MAKHPLFHPLPSAFSDNATQHAAPFLPWTLHGHRGAIVVTTVDKNVRERRSNKTTKMGKSNGGVLLWVPRDLISGGGGWLGFAGWGSVRHALQRADAWHPHGAKRDVLGGCTRV